MDKPGKPQSTVPEPASTDLSVRFQIGVREHVSAHRALILRHPAGWVLYGLLLAVPLGMIIYLAFLDRHPHPEKWVLVAAAAVVSAVTWYSFPWGPVLSLRKGLAHIDGPQIMTYVPSRGPECHPGRPFGQYPHIHIGPVDHINVR